MKRLYIIDRNDIRREKAELFIKNVYFIRYGARIDDFPSRLISLVDDHDEIVCATGIRTAEDGFFSEKYLDSSIDSALSALSGAPIDRNQVLEVSNLASLSPGNINEFIKCIILFGYENKFSWSFFTLTTRLHNLLKRIGIVPIYIAEARKERINNFEKWGSYYNSQPMIYAIPGPLCVQGRQGALSHASL